MSCVFRLFPSRMKEITVFLASFRAARTIIPSFLRHSFLRGVSDSVSCSPHFFAISMYCVSKSVSDSILSKNTVVRLQNVMEGGKIQRFLHFPHTSLTIVLRKLLSLHHRFCEPDAQSVRLADEILLLTEDAYNVAIFCFESRKFYVWKIRQLKVSTDGVCNIMSQSEKIGHDISIFPDVGSRTLLIPDKAMREPKAG